MASLKGRIRRLQRDAQAEGIVLELRDGSRRIFDDMTCWKEMFLAKCDLAREEARQSPVLETVRQATPESRATFEQKYGTITPELHIVASVEDGGWVEVYKLEEDGTITKTHHEGGTPEAERIIEEARRAGPAF